MANDGTRIDEGIEAYPANTQDIRSYRVAQQQLSQLQAPVLLHRNNPHERLYVAVLDGTGNNMYKDDDAHETGIVRIYKQIESDEGQKQHPNIWADYVTGIGTEGSWPYQKGDGARGHTFEERTETMYQRFIVYAANELTKDPQAQIRVAAIGFSRGAEEVAYFTRLVHERGIQNPDGATYTRDENGLVTSVKYTKPPLVSPGQVAQAALLQDPVATGDPLNYDRRLPHSVISGFQITAQDERRDQFLSTPHLPPGLSENRRFLNVTVGGAHSDIGDSYPVNGLGIRSTNLAVDYLNALSDKPFLQKRAEPSDPQQNVVHRSEQHLSWRPFGVNAASAYTTTIFDREGHRGRNVDLGRQSWNDYLISDDPANNVKEPIDSRMDRQFERRSVPIAPPAVEAAPSQRPRTFIPPIPDHLKDFRHPGHPQHGHYRGVLREVHRMEDTHRIRPGPHSERMAAAWADRLGQERPRFALDRFEMRGQDVVAMERRDNYFEPRRELALNADQALSRPVEQVSADWSKRVMPHLDQPQPTAEHANPSQRANHDLQQSGHVRQGQFDGLRERIADVYAKAGVVRSEAQLERATAAVALDMQRYRLDGADHLCLLPNRDGVIGPESGIGALQGQYPLQLRSQTSPEAMQQAPDESYRQLAQVTQQQTLEQQQRQTAAQGQQSGLSIG